LFKVIPNLFFVSGDYFQYINVPAPATFEWGYRRGAPEHNREEYLSQKDHTFKAKVKKPIKNISQTKLTIKCGSVVSSCIAAVSYGIL
jgi:hypothetical protein